MSKVEGGPIDPLPLSRLRVTIFSSRLQGLNQLKKTGKLYIRIVLKQYTVDFVTIFVLY